MRLIMKFGGTSMAGSDRIKHAAGLALAAGREHEVVTVVSAMDGMTERLLDLAEAAGAGKHGVVESLLASIRADHEKTAAGLNAPDTVASLLARLDTLARGIAAVEELTPRSRDAVVAFGELLAASMMGAAMKARAFSGHQAGIVTNDHFGEADPLMDISMYQVRQNLEPLLKQRQPVVVTGFVAANQHGVTSTLGRGGSDYTATILGAALRADEIWIWSDVDGLMTADPRVVPDARLLSGITFEEAVEMGKFGAKSMHPRALEPAAQHEIPVRMRNTFKPEGAGTLISRAPALTSNPVRAVPALKNMAMLTVGGPGIIGRQGTAATVFSALAQARVNVHMISQSVSEAGISVVVSGKDLASARAALQKALHPEGLAEHIDVQQGLSVVAVVGPGMRGTTGIAARTFTAIAREHINVIAIAQGSSELSISLAVRDESGPQAVKALHAEFQLERS
jgi:aspartate kinase